MKSFTVRLPFLLALIGCSLPVLFYVRTPSELLAASMPPSYLAPTPPPTSETLDTSLQVDTTTDDGALNACNDAVATDCSLRGAIQQANLNSSRAFTIVVPAGVYQLTLAGANEDGNATGDLDVTNPTGVMIQGAGAESTLLQAGSNANDGIDRVLEVGYNGRLTLQGVTVRYGQAVNGGPGAIYSNSNAVLTILESTITANTSATTGLDRVGGIWNDGQLTLHHSTFSANDGTAGGVGALYNRRGGVTSISNSSFSSNRGMALYNEQQLTIADSTFADNQDTGGGASGLYNSGTVTVERSTFVNNSSTSIAGALFNSGTAIVRNSTFSGNTAIHGGGVLNNGLLTVDNSTFSANRATQSTSSGNLFNNAGGTLHLQNTILANSAGGADCKNDGVLVTNTNNLIEDNSCAPLLSGDPNLGLFQNNGGATATYALLPGSPAIDAGDNSACLATDQRGSARPSDGNGDGMAVCDIGAYEVPAAFVIPPPYLTEWGAYGLDVGQFNDAHGIAVDNSGNVYITDFFNHRVQKFTNNGIFLRSWGGPGAGSSPGEFNGPWGVAVDSSGNVYIADTNNQCIKKFDSNGVYLTQWGSYGRDDGQFLYPSGVAVDSNNHVYVADYNNNRIQKFDSNGTYLTQWSNDQLGRVPAVAVDSAGNVYVADYDHHRIQKFDSNGVYLAQWGEPGSGNGQFANPSGVAVDSRGNVYVTDEGNSRVQEFDSNGVYLTQWGSPGYGHGQFGAPFSIAIDSRSNIFVGDNNQRIQKFGAPAPAVDVSGNTVVIAHNDATPDIADGTDFGRAAVTSGVVTHTFTIRNTGAAVLTLTGSPLVLVSGTNADDFSITTLPASSVAVGDSTTFQLRFAPSAAGVRTATITIASNDSMVNPYTFVVQGVGNAVAPAAWLTNPANGHAYATLDCGTWLDCQAAVATMNDVYLVTIADQAEQDWLVQTFGGVPFWIGLTDEAQEGEWQWTNGEPVIYTNWSSGEPNEGGCGEDYGMINWEDNGRWNDLGPCGWDYTSTAILEANGVASPATTTSLALVRGWNLVALPVLPADGAPGPLLASLAGQYNTVYAYNGCDAVDPWKKYEPTAPFPFLNDLNRIGVGQGLWLRTTNAATLTVTGRNLTNIAIPLCVGWNLISWPGDAATPVATALAQLDGQYNLVYAYDASDPVDPWKKYDPAAPFPFLNDLAQLKPGQGYWRRVTQSTTLLVP